MIKVPMKPKTDPITIEGKPEDRNKWVWDLHEKLGNLIDKALIPLDDYLKTFDVYVPILEMNPDKEMREKANDENL
jgi:hypothetical protein